MKKETQTRVFQELKSCVFYWIKLAWIERAGNGFSLARIVHSARGNCWARWTWIWIGTCSLYALICSCRYYNENGLSITWNVYLPMYEGKCYEKVFIKEPGEECGMKDVISGPPNSGRAECVAAVFGIAVPRILDPFTFLARWSTVKYSPRAWSSTEHQRHVTEHTSWNWQSSLLCFLFLFSHRQYYVLTEIELGREWRVNMLWGTQAAAGVRGNFAARIPWANSGRSLGVGLGFRAGVIGGGVQLLNRERRGLLTQSYSQGPFSVRLPPRSTKFPHSFSTPFPLRSSTFW